MKSNYLITKSTFIISLSFLISFPVYGQNTDNTVQFNKKLIASESYESVGVFDVNGDGNLDIISGSFWYEGPEFLDRHTTINKGRHGQYWDDFATIPLDMNGNGLEDYVTGGWFSKSIVWRENPGNHDEWQEHIIDETGNVETIRAWDVDSDGHLEIVPNNPNDPLKYYKLERNSDGKSIGEFNKVTVYNEQGHGLGFGDVNGDGRGDFIVSAGWLEAPADINNGSWTLHNEFDLGSASIPIQVIDVNRDGKNDLIVGQAHGYGLDWYEQTSDASGERAWKKHSIDPDNSQFHTLEIADLDGDGSKELITGKRYRAHNGGDPGANDPIGIYYYKWNGESFAKHIIAYDTLGEGKGTGIYFSIADINGTGRNDIIVAGKDGLYIFYNEGH
ncbi:MAG: VCBS repeat-containing protein [Balneolales bacterium]